MAYEDNRNWPEYTSILVRRGWFYLSADFVKNWDEELKRMNKKKNGHPYRYPEIFISKEPHKLPFLKRISSGKANPLD